MTFDRKLELSLFTLRLGVFIVMFMWVIDKFVNPEHTAAVFGKFYMIDGLSETAAYGIGGVQAVIYLAFLLGIKKRLSYGLVFLMHGLSTISTYEQLLDPWGPRNLLFYAAIPMLAACFALYMLRERDTFLTVKKV